MTSIAASLKKLRRWFSCGLSALCVCLFLTACGEVPAAPRVLTAKLTDGNVVLSWETSEEAEGYRLFRKYAEENDYKFIMDAGAEETSYTDRFVDPGRSYSYKIEIIGENGISEALESSVTVPEEAPVIEMVEQVEEELFKLTLANADGRGFTVYGFDGQERRRLCDGEGALAEVTTEEDITSLSVCFRNSELFSEEVRLLRAPKITSVTKLDSYMVLTAIEEQKSCSYEVYRSSSKEGAYSLCGTADLPYYYDEHKDKETDWYYRVLAVSDHARSLLGKARKTGYKPLDTYEVPVMMYHEFVTEEDLKAGIAFDEYAIYQDEFESDLKWLKENGYTTITVSQLADFMEGKGTLPEKPIILSIDDGKYGVYKRAYPLLQKYNMKAVLALIGYEIDDATRAPEDRATNPAPYCTWEEIAEMSADGAIEMISHTQYLHVYDSGDGRKGASSKKDDTMDTFLPVAQKDYIAICRNFRDHGVPQPQAMAYPYSVRTKLSDKAWLESGFRILFAGAKDDVRMNEFNSFVQEAGLNPVSSVLRRITRMTGTPIDREIG